ncbi:hypothetical protein NMY22_g10855 [Coprinellus aureogranulatus]|nr:hypothetical protein NMY22_g10855 [Coprinellus aureogranulatus]
MAAILDANIQRNIAHTSKSSLDLVALTRDVENDMEVIESRIAPTTRKLHSYILGLWAEFTHPDNPKSVGMRMFTEGVVKAKAAMFPLYIVRLLLLGIRLNADTSQQSYMQAFVSLVGKFCIKLTEDLIHVGWDVMRNGLYKRILDGTSQAILKEGLLREMVCGCMHDAGKTMVALSQTSCTLFTFYGSLRPSSLGITGQGEEEKKNFPVVGDAKFYCNGFCNMQVTFKCRFLKGYMHGLNFATPKVLDFLKSLSDPATNMELDPDQLEEPLFPAATEGGRGFVEPLQPASTRSYAEHLNHCYEQVGLPRAGVAALQRDCGNSLAVDFGVQVTQAALNHVNVSSKIFDQNYSKGAANYNVVAMRLREQDCDGGPIPLEQYTCNNGLGPRDITGQFINVFTSQQLCNDFDLSTIALYGQNWNHGFMAPQSHDAAMKNL